MSDGLWPPKNKCVTTILIRTHNHQANQYEHAILNTNTTHNLEIDNNICILKATFFRFLLLPFVLIFNNLNLSVFLYLQEIILNMGIRFYRIAESFFSLHSLK